MTDEITDQMNMTDDGHEKENCKTQKDLKAAMTTIVSSIINISEYLDESTAKFFNESVESSRHCMTKLIEEEFNADKCVTVQNKLKNSIEESLQEGNDIEDLEELYQNALAQEDISDRNVDKHEMMIKFEAAVSRGLERITN